MKNTVYTVITVVLLMATLCLPATAQRWVLEDSWAGPADDRNNGNFIADIEFRDNNQVFFGKRYRLYKWDFTTSRAHWLDFGDKWVSEVEVPRNFGSVVIYSVGGRIEIRDASDLSYITGANVEGVEVKDLDVDDDGEYIVGLTYTEWNWHTGGGGRWWTFDIWGPNGWQLERHDFNRDHTVAAACIHPTSDSPTRYFAYTSDPDLIRKRLGRTSYGNSFITSTPADDQVWGIAAGRFQGSTRVAGIVASQSIDVWDWSGGRLFTFNRNGAKDLNTNILEFTPNGELLATATSREVIFWDMSTREKDPSSFTPNIPSSTRITALAFSDNGRYTAVGTRAGGVYIYEWTGGSAPAAPAQEAEPAQPTALLENYPNPFNPETWIPYQLSAAAEVTVTIHSSDGKLVRTLELGQVPAGVYSEKDRAAYWDGQNEQGEPVASGVYFYTLTAGEFSATRKMVIRK